MKPIWIVDDDQSIRFVLEKALTREEFAVRSFTNSRDVLAALEDSEPQVLVSDIRMPGGSGIDLLNKIKAKHRELPVIIMTAYSDLDSAVGAFQGGAFDYLPKPFDVPKAVDLIRRAVEESLHEGGAEAPVAQVPEILGQAPAMQDVFRAIGRLSQSIVTVLITGESGHRQGARRQRAAQAQPARKRAVRRDQHRRDPEGPARVGAVRPRARRVHRRADDAARPLRAGRRRHALPRRDRRHAVRPADAPAARPRRRPVLSRRRPQPDEEQRARDRRDAPGPRAAREGGRVPRGPVPPPQRDPPAPAAAARAHRGHRAARALLPAEERARARRRGQAHDRCGDRPAGRVRLPGQRAPAREHLPLADRDGAGAARRRRGPAARASAAIGAAGRRRRHGAAPGSERDRGSARDVGRRSACRDDGHCTAKRRRRGSGAARRRAVAGWPASSGAPASSCRRASRWCGRR